MIFVKVTLLSIPTDLKNRRIARVLRFANDLQINKHGFPVFVDLNQDFMASNSLIWRFYEARF